jgi:hypothetical protein
VLLVVAAGDEGTEVVRRHPHAGGVEGHAGIERITIVERLALTTLVVGLAGGEPRGPESGGHDRHHQHPTPGRLTDAPAPGSLGQDRLQDQGQREERVRGLRVGGHPDEDRGQGRPAPPPGDQPGGQQAEVEDLRGQPEEVDGHGPEDEDPEHRGESGPGRGDPAPLGIAEPEGEAEGDGVEKEQPPVGAEQTDERRPDQRVEEGLAVHEAGLPASVVHALQKDPLRPPGVDALDPREVLGLEVEIEVAGQALGHRAVRRGIAPELAVRGQRQVGGQGRDHGQPDEHPEDDPCGSIAHGSAADAKGGPISSRISTKAPTDRPSARSAPRRDRRWITWRNVS